MRNESPLVSIITPSYKQGRFIEETILSVKNQDYPNIEHIIMDGASTDNTVEILKKYEGTYNMRWISELDEGQADAVNKGFAMAKGEIIGWLNSDDLLFHNRTISEVVTAFSDGDVDIVYGHAIKINADNKVMRVRIVPMFDYELLKRWCFLVQPAVFFRSKVIKQDQLRIELDYSMDYEYWLRLSPKYSWNHSGKILAIDRNHRERKIIANRAHSIRESSQLRYERGVFSGPSQELLDKIYKGWLRVKGLRWLVWLYIHRDEFPYLIFDNSLCLIKHQLYGKEDRLF